jgi:aspartate aminotransferase
MLMTETIPRPRGQALARGSCDDVRDAKHHGRSPARARAHEPEFIRADILAMRESAIEELWRLGSDVTGLIGLWTGEADLPTASFICEAASEGLRAGKTFYSHNRGLPPMRDALAAYHRRIWGMDIPEDRIALTHSGMNAAMLIAQATLRRGDNMVAITPCWPNIMRAAQINGAAVREVALSRDARGWRLDLDRVLAACDAGTRLIYLASPGNPTGWMIEPHEARMLLDETRARGVAVLSDEVYHRLVYDRSAAFSLLEIARPDDGVFVVNSFSKAWAMSGWRLGWIVYPRQCRDVIEKLIQFNTCGGLEFLQHGAIAALDEGETFVASLVARCRAGRDLVNHRLTRMPRVHMIPQASGFYALFAIEGVTDTMAFCRRAISEAHLGMAPGEGFGAGAEGLVRICYAKGQQTLTEAMDRLETFVAAYREK